MACLHVERDEMSQLTGVIDGGIEFFSYRVKKGAGNRTEWVFGNVPVGGDGELSQGIEVLHLPLVFPFDPARPLIIEAGAVDILELGGKEPPAVVGPVIPLEKFFRAVLVDEVGDESSAVEVRIRAGLKIYGGAL